MNEGKKYNNDLLSILPLKEKNKYNNYIFKQIQIKKSENKTIEIFYGINKNNDNDVLFFKKINIEEKFNKENEYYHILKECKLLEYFKNYDYFPQDVHLLLSENEQYL